MGNLTPKEDFAKLMSILDLEVIEAKKMRKESSFSYVESARFVVLRTAPILVTLLRVTFDPIAFHFSCMLAHCKSSWELAFIPGFSYIPL